MKAWKVFYREDNKLFSYHKFNYTTHFTQEYKRGEINYPLISGSAIFCFSTKELAREFAPWNTTSLVILEVEIEPFDVDISMIVNHASHVNYFWEVIEKEKDDRIGYDYKPCGTIFAKSLRILEE